MELSPFAVDPLLSSVVEEPMAIEVLPIDKAPYFLFEELEPMAILLLLLAFDKVPIAIESFISPLGSVEWTYWFPIYIFLLPDVDFFTSSAVLSGSPLPLLLYLTALAVSPKNIFWEPVWLAPVVEPI